MLSRRGRAAGLTALVSGAVLAGLLLAPAAQAADGDPVVPPIVDVTTDPPLVPPVDPPPADTPPAPDPVPAPVVPAEPLPLPTEPLPAPVDPAPVDPAPVVPVEPPPIVLPAALGSWCEALYPPQRPKVEKRKAWELMRGTVDMGNGGTYYLSEHPNWRPQSGTDTSGDRHVHSLDWALPLLYRGVHKQKPEMVERFRQQSPRFIADLQSDLGMLGCDVPTLAEHFVTEGALNLSGARVRRFLMHPSERHVAQAMMAVPLRIRGKIMGFLVAVGFQRGRRFDEGQRKLLSAVGSRAAAAIENAKLYENLKATFNQTIQGLARAIDTMDRYTAGHSDRVAYYSRVLATQLKLPPDQVETVRQAALMHDIGKIGCVLNLNRPGRLTPEEYEIFKKHPGYGREILEPIKFLHPLLPGVHLHHERWDGKGYPLGLKGEEIPVIARIISVADTYDAMTSDRSYRRALPHDVAINEVERCGGSQFDPGVSAPFLHVIELDREEKTERGETVPE